MSLISVEECRKLIAIDSTPARGTKEIMSHAAELCRGLGLEVTLDSDTLGGVEQANLVARFQEAVDSELILQSHLDTVDPGHFSAWSETRSNPFAASIHDGTIYGLGAADAKLDFLCKLEALRELGTRKWQAPPVIVGTFGSQMGMSGAIKLLRKKRLNGRRALIGEPTNLCLGNAGMGLAIIEISVPFSLEETRYREHHDEIESGSTQSRMFVEKSGSSAWGGNAIVKALEYLIQLPAGIAIMDLDGGSGAQTKPNSAVLEIDVVGSFRDPIVPKLAQVVKALRHMVDQLEAHADRPSINLGMIRTFGDHIRLTGSCRLPPAVKESEYEQWIAEMRTQCAEVGATFSVNEYKAAFVTAVESKFVHSCVQVAQAMNYPPNLRSIGSSTEANVLSRFGIECLVFGPGEGLGNAQGPNEKIRIEDLQKATRFYCELIREICL